MELTDFRWQETDGHPSLRFKIDGNPVEAFWEQKLATRRAGILVLLGTPFTRKLPKQVVPPDPKDGRNAQLEIECAIRSPMAMGQFNAMMEAPLDLFLDRASRDST